MDATSLLDASATEIAEAVRSGHVTAVDVLEVHLARIAEREPHVGAFVRVLADSARAEAAAVDADPGRASLPLAGVPVAIKDNVAVEGLPTGHGSRALPGEHAAADDLLVARWRAAGAVIVGTTWCPELSVFGNTDNPAGAVRNPWDPSRVVGGSSGGSAAAVAAGMVPMALASDGMGSIRVPAAANGLVGMKPGTGLLPVDGDVDGQHWFGMTQFGPLATTVDDIALGLDLFGGFERFRKVGEPNRPLRVAISTAPPAPGIIVGKEQRAAVAAIGRALREAGHEVVQDDPPYDMLAIVDLMLRWTAGTAQDVEALGADVSLLQPRTRRHAAVGRLLSRVRPVRPAQADRWKAKVDAFLGGYDLLVTPLMATAQTSGHGWWERGWLANVLQGLLWVPFPSAWNLAELPAASVPAGISSLRLPLAAQLVAPRGREDDLIAVLRQLERIAPWQRHP